MNSLNSVLIEGNLVRDPIRYISKDIGNDTVCATFKIASHRWFSQDGEKQDEVSYFDIECWNSIAKSVLDTLSKGRGVRVVGRLKEDRWADTDGQNHQKVKIVAEVVEFKTQFDKHPSEVKEIE